jgi:hypothetical protein
MDRMFPTQRLVSTAFVLTCVLSLGCASTESPSNWVDTSSPSDVPITPQPDLTEPEDSSLVDTGTPEVAIEDTTGLSDIEVMGCGDAPFKLPIEFVAVRMEPSDPTLTVASHQSAKTTFSLVVTTTDGVEETLDDVYFNMSSPALGSLTADGKFSSNPSAGGQATVQALADFGCIETTVTVITVFHQLTQGANPNLPGWFQGVLGGNSEQSCNGICDAWQNDWPCQCTEGCELVPGGCCPDYAAYCDTTDDSNPIPELLYPLDGAAWPSTLPPMVVQWTQAKTATTPVFRIGLEAAFAHIYIYGTHTEWKTDNGGYAATLPDQAWTNVWALGGGVHKVTVASAFTQDNSLTNVRVSQSHAMNATSDKFGGAVYYWNIKHKGIRVLDLSKKPLVDESVNIGGSCHGCHAASPDGESIAATFNIGATDPICGTASQADMTSCATPTTLGWYYNPSTKTNQDGSKLSKGCHEATGCDCGSVCDLIFESKEACEDSCKAKMWTMQIHDVETGAKADFIHPAAEAFLEGGGVMYPAFSNAFWAGDNKHVVVTQGGSMPGTARHLYSVNLIDGDVWEMTDGSEPGLGGQQLFPAMARNGEFVIFSSSTGSTGKGGLGINGDCQLWRMPYNNGLGGTPTPLYGADDPDLLQYYPAVTPDDTFVVYNRAQADTSACPNPTGKGGPGGAGTYDNCLADLWIIPSSGGVAVRLDKASGPANAGFGNSWPSMSDKVSGKHYWVAFSSRRPYGVTKNWNGASEGPSGIGTKPSTPSKTVYEPQLWVAAVNPEAIASGEDPSFAPIWLPGQDDNGGNHIGQWSMR